MDGNSNPGLILIFLLQMIKMMVTVVVFYSVCWLPYNILMVSKLLVLFFLRWHQNMQGVQYEISYLYVYYHRVEETAPAKDHVTMIYNFGTNCESGFLIHYCIQKNIQGVSFEKKVGIIHRIH